MTAALSLIGRLRQAGATLMCSPDGRVRFVAPAPLPPDLLAEARQHRDDIALALTGPVDLGALPTGQCPGCGGWIYWRLSVLSGGPGPWHCERCIPPDPADWIDGSAVSVREGLAGHRGRRVPAIQGAEAPATQH